MQKNIEYIEKLGYLLKNEPLPGTKAHSLMLPEYRFPQEFYINQQKNAKKSSVLILLYSTNEGIKTVLIKRSEYKGVHSGQISFPGGQLEKTDSSLTFTAIREANEEIGIDASKVEVIGYLSKLYIPPSNFEVLPVVAFYNSKPQFKIDKTEVDKTIEVKLELLMDDNTKQNTEINLHSLKFTTPCYNINGNIVWGATAMIISELLEILRQINCKRQITKGK